MLYLAHCKISVSRYMGGTDKIHKNHIVEAEDESLAIKKIENFYRQKDDAYCVSYSVEIVDIDECIV